MSGFWLSPGSPEELGLICKASKSPWEEAWYLGWLCGLWQSFQGRNEGCFPERWLKNKNKTTLQAQWKPQGFKWNNWYRRSQVADVWLCFCALRGGLKVSLKVPWVSSSEANLKIIGDPGCSWCVYANKQAELKVRLKVVTLITIRVILRRKIIV